MNTFIETQLVEMTTPELAQQIVTELAKRFDPDSNLAILSCTNNIEEDFVEFMICHSVLVEDSINYTVYCEHFYSLVHKDDLWEMTFLESSTSYQERNYYECPLVPKAKEPQQLELDLFD
jgi:hypothetical protein